MRLRKVLVVGASVSGRRVNFIAEAAQRLEGPLAGLQLTRCAVDGLSPDKLCFLLPGILDGESPDAVVFELAAHGFRTTATPAAHQDDLHWMLQLCAERHIAVAFLDLPRFDVDQDNDWVNAMHKSVAEAEGLAYRRVPLRNELLWDGVHCKPEGDPPFLRGGIEYYAVELLALLEVLAANPVEPIIRNCATIRHFVPVAADEVNYVHCQYGLRVPVQPVPEGETISLTVPRGLTVVGVGCLTHPKAGNLIITAGDGRYRRVVPTYTTKSYYERFIVRGLAVPGAQELKVTQTPTIPTVELNKGTKDLGPRIGYVAGLLCTSARHP